MRFSLNNLSRGIPATAGLHLQNLKELILRENQIKEEIPQYITNASMLEILSLEGNFLTGAIPTNLGNFHELRVLLLHSNQLTNEPREHELRFFNSLADSRMLRYVEMGNNPLNGTYILDAHINGLIAQGIGNMSGLIELSFEGNNLTGSIPSEIEFPLSILKMSGLLYLDVSQNFIEGEVPSDVGELNVIVELDLSGTIPRSLENLLYLKAFNVSFNDLEGEIPSGGVFVNSTLQSFLGNKGLWGMHILEVPACATVNPKQQSKFKEVLLKNITPVFTSSFLIFLLVSIWIMKRQKKGKPKDVERVPEINTYQLISYHEIQRATDNFVGPN
ncbi:putative receptor-like protein kinase [Capsicum annuum]|uniref:putative receptor-like protein kinase At3g47110 n=1 Tax=Capsicum annuum TaxID=4072 RepID=UPI001FB11AD7|nr:putative receptor-like protein kinase At3g47110 [Capsicum annuum]